MNNKQNDDNKNNEKSEMVSFSEVDKNGVFREAYGYFEPKRETNIEEDEYFEKRIEEMNDLLKKR